MEPKNSHTMQHQSTEAAQLQGALFAEISMANNSPNDGSRQSSKKGAEQWHASDLAQDPTLYSKTPQWTKP